MRRIIPAILTLSLVSPASAAPPDPKARVEIQTLSKRFKSLRGQGRKLVKSGLGVKAREIAGRGGFSKAAVLTFEAVCGEIAPGGRSVAHIAMQVAGRWALLPALFETENSGCCGAHNEYTIGELTVRDVADTPGQELVAQIAFEDQDADMGVDSIYHRSWDATLACGVHRDAPWCQYFKSREAHYNGPLEKFLDGAINASCWAVTLADGVATRQPAACEGQKKAATGLTLRYDIRTGTRR